MKRKIGISEVLSDRAEQCVEGISKRSVSVPKCHALGKEAG